MQEERKERQERRRWMRDEDVHIVSFITALKFLVFFFLVQTQKSVQTKNDRTGTVKKKERCTVELHARDCWCRFHPIIGV